MQKKVETLLLDLLIKEEQSAKTAENEVRHCEEALEEHTQKIHILREALDALKVEIESPINEQK